MMGRMEEGLVVGAWWLRDKMDVCGGEGMDDNG